MDVLTDIAAVAYALAAIGKLIAFAAVGAGGVLGGALGLVLLWLWARGVYDDVRP